MADGDQGLWLYKDRDGREHLVGTIDQVPADLRSKAIEVGAAPIEAVKEASGTARGVLEDAVSALRPGGGRVDPGSFGLGFGAAGALVLAFVLARFAPRWVFRLVVLVIIAAVGSVGYLTFVRHQVGLPGIGTPDRMVEDAREAVQRANSAMKERTQALEQLDPSEPTP